MGRGLVPVPRQPDNVVALFPFSFLFSQC
jgi:hypothetical protein